MTLHDLPDSFPETRAALHQLAFFVISPTRYSATGRMGLEATHGGFGTPEFGGRVARVECDLLVDSQGGNVATRTISTLRDAAEFFGIVYEPTWFPDFRDPLQPTDPDRGLDVDPVSAMALGAWFDFGFEILGDLRSHSVDGDGPSTVQLWPEHFDPATELGDQERGRRASYGASPGDDVHTEPYLYIAPWGEKTSDDFWNDASFGGASLPYSRLREADDPKDVALEFLLAGHRRLHAR